MYICICIYRERGTEEERQRKRDRSIPFSAKRNRVRAREMERDRLTSGYWGRPCLPLHAPWQSLRQMPLLRLSRRDSQHCLHIKAYMCKYMPTYHNSSVFDYKQLSVWIFEFLDVSRAQSMGLRSSVYACVCCMHLTFYEPRQCMCPCFSIAHCTRFCAHELWACAQHLVHWMGILSTCGTSIWFHSCLNFQNALHCT